MKPSVDILEGLTTGVNIHEAASADGGLFFSVHTKNHQTSAPHASETIRRAYLALCDYLLFVLIFFCLCMHMFMGRCLCALKAIFFS